MHIAHNFINNILYLVFMPKHSQTVARYYFFLFQLRMNLVRKKYIYYNSTNCCVSGAILCVYVFMCVLLCYLLYIHYLERHYKVLIWVG